MDTLGLCQFVYGPAWQMYGPQDQADLLAAATGWPVTVDDIQTCGQRRLNLMRALNAREGLARDQDTLPKKLFRKPLSGGRSDGLVLDQAELDAGLEEYYRQAGWDTNSGVPKRETLEELGLGWAADDLGL
jgi:aldehyde:ferredoxin oxidoreductase